MSAVRPGRVLLVDDDALVREAIAESLELAGLTVTAFARAEPLLRQADVDFDGVIVSDMRMPGLDGLELFRAVHALDPDIPFILITGHGDVPMAVAALKDGVDDFLAKPFATGHLIASIRRGLERRRLQLENRAMRETIARVSGRPAMLIGEAPAIIRLRESIERFAASDLSLLIHGEAGTGKSLAAMLLHRGGARTDERIVTVDCEAAQLAEIEAALSGAGSEPASTVVLDGIERLPLQLQDRLLTLIEPSTSGSPRPRLIATLRGDPHVECARGTLRDDLYFALGMIQLRIPPLRERRADIPLLFAHFVEEAAARLQRPQARFTDAVRRHFFASEWPGNVRELRSFAFASAAGIDARTSLQSAEEPASLPERVEHFEASVLRATLEQCHGNAGQAIGLLGLPRKTFYDKLHRHSIDIARYRR